MEDKKLLSKLKSRYMFIGKLKTIKNTKKISHLFIFLLRSLFHDLWPLDFNFEPDLLLQLSFWLVISCLNYYCLFTSWFGIYISQLFFLLEPTLLNAYTLQGNVTLVNNPATFRAAKYLKLILIIILKLMLISKS